MFHNLNSGVDPNIQNILVPRTMMIQYYKHFSSENNDDTILQTFQKENFSCGIIFSLSTNIDVMIVGERATYERQAAAADFTFGLPTYASVWIT